MAWGRLSKPWNVPLTLASRRLIRQLLGYSAPAYLPSIYRYFPIDEVQFLSSFNDAKVTTGVLVSSAPVLRNNGRAGSTLVQADNYPRLFGSLPPVFCQFTLYPGPSGSTENPSSSGPLALALSIYQLRRARWKPRMPLRLAMRYSQLRSAIPTITPKVYPKNCWLAQLVNMPTRALIWLEYARKLPGI